MQEWRGAFESPSRHQTDPLPRVPPGAPRPRPALNVDTSPPGNFDWCLMRGHGSTAGAQRERSVNSNGSRRDQRLRRCGGGGARCRAAIPRRGTRARWRRGRDSLYSSRAARGCRCPRPEEAEAPSSNHFRATACTSGRQLPLPGQGPPRVLCSRTCPAPHSASLSRQGCCWPGPSAPPPPPSARCPSGPRASCPPRCCGPPPPAPSPAASGCSAPTPPGRSGPASCGPRGPPPPACPAAAAASTPRGTKHLHSF